MEKKVEKGTNDIGLAMIGIFDSRSTAHILNCLSGIESCKVDELYNRVRPIIESELGQNLPKSMYEMSLKTLVKCGDVEIENDDVKLTQSAKDRLTSYLIVSK